MLHPGEPLAAHVGDGGAVGREGAAVEVAPGHVVRAVVGEGAAAVHLAGEEAGREGARGQAVGGSGGDTVVCHVMGTAVLTSAPSSALSPAGSAGPATPPRPEPAV